jgi:hypothetical protein
MKEKEGPMPAGDAIIVSLIVLAFLIFGMVLAWADYQTSHIDHGK